ncbi:MAG: response regulator [Methylococcales bacterium]|nr:response regulator [Methylococcales bacterium]
MMRVIEKHNISLEQQVIERTEELIDAKEIAEHANRAKSTFLANMSHEIRTPLNHVLGFAEIISEEDDVDEMHDCAIKIETAGKHLLGLINDILDLSKIESDGMDLRLSSFNLDELTANINDLFTATCQTKDIELTILNQLPNHTVVADMQRLQQIMINIVGNAVKFIEQGSIKFHIDKVDNLYLFEVIDTGPGMDQKTVDNIFKPFEQGYAGHDKGGTGLGMAITHRFIEMMQGQITIQSEQGAGSCFSITLPLKTANDNIETDDLDKSKKSHIQLKNIKALIVDDNELNRELLKFFLKKEGINAQMAINGKQCCDILEKVTEEDSPDIIFMDIRMPVMSGDDAFLYCKKRHPKIKYIAATSSVMKKDLDQYKNLGFDGYLPKPMSMSGVLKILKKVLE